MLTWREISGNWLMIPDDPIAIVHFLGGAFVATAPHLTYRLLLEYLAEQGYLIVATPFVNTFDHTAIARQALLAFDRALEYIETRILYQQATLPIYGLGHSMGCKLHLLIGSLFGEERAGNIFMAFNNYPAKRSIPLLEQMMQFAPMMNVEFIPSPAKTFELVEQEYTVQRNLLIQFSNDDIDQTRSLEAVLSSRFPKLTAIQTLPGNHLTPLGQDIKWQAGDSFSPLDAIGQFMRQEVYRDMAQLQRNLLLWLDPFAFSF